MRVHPSGRKVYIVKTRYQGRIIKVTIGPHDAVSATYARVRAAEIITDARAGKNPKGRRSNALTMRALGERFLKEYVPNHCKPSTAAEYRRSVEHFINPRIGKLRVPDVQRSNIAALHHDMRKTPYQANRTLGALSKMFNLAELWELRPDGTNPCRHVKRFKEDKRERFLSDAEYRRLGSVPAGDRAGRLRDCLRDRCDPAPDADRLPAFGDPEAALGACRPGDRRAQAAGHQDRRQGGPSRRTPRSPCCATSSGRTTTRGLSPDARRAAI